MSIDIKVNADTNPAVAELKKLETQVAHTTEAFNKIKDAVAGFAAVGFIHSLLEMADGLSDAAKAAGVSTEALMGFSAALSANGGNAEGALKGIAAFSQQIAQAAEGSKGAQDAFLKVGVGLKELGALSEEDLLKKTILGIAAIEDPSRRAAAGMANFGKAAKGVDFVGVANDIDKFIQKNKEAASAIETAGDVADSLDATYKSFKVQILVALEPIAKLASAILEQKDAIGILIKALVDIGAAFLIFTKVIPWISGVKGELAAAAIEGWTFKEVITKIGGAALGPLAGLATQFSLLKDALIGGAAAGLAGATALERLGLAASAILGIFSRFLGIVAVLWAVYDVINAITKAATGSGLIEWGEKALKALGIISQTTAEREKAAKATEAQAKANREVTDAMAQEQLALDKILSSYIRTTDEANKKFKAETESLNISTEQKLLKEQIAEADKNYVETIIKLTDEYNAKRATGSESDARMLPLIQKKIQDAAAAREAETQTIKDNVAARIAGLKITDLENFGIKEQVGLQDKLQSLTDDMAKSTMTELEKKNYDILAAARLQGKQAADNFEIANKTKLTEAERQGYIDAAVAGTDKLIAKNTEAYNQSRSFSTGWANAFNDYVTNATNAADLAKNIFNKFTQGLEDSIVNFAKTGKFEWKNFVAGMAEELLRSQIKQTLAGIFTLNKPKTGAGGAVSALGGAAAGVTARGNNAATPVYVQSVGSDLLGGQSASPSGTTDSTSVFEDIKTSISDFSTGVSNFLSNMFSNLGSFISNMTGSLGNILSSVGSTLFDVLSSIGGTLFDVISSLGSGLGDVLSGIGSIGGGGGGGSSFGLVGDIVGGIASFFGFANGGIIPNNKPVIVGEKGPEILQGAGGMQVIPNGQAFGGGSTSVTYNINAVDAMSFKQMIAADPSFLYAVTQQGSKGMPVRR